MSEEKKETNTFFLDNVSKEPEQRSFDIEDSLVIEEVLKKRALESARGQIHDKPRWAER
jgi:hypothetical protein